VPYSKPSDVPDNVPAKHKAQFMEVWNSAYKAAKDDKKSDADAEAWAFQNAWGVIKKSKEKDRDVSSDGPGFGPVEKTSEDGGQVSCPQGDAISNLRFSEDQPRDPNGKFASGSVSDPHASDVVKQNGGFVPHAKEPLSTAGAKPGDIVHGPDSTNADRAVLAEHMNEFLKEGNVDAYTAFKAADKVLGGGKLTFAQATSAHGVLSEHLSDAQKEGNHQLASTLKSAMSLMKGGRSLSQTSDTGETTVKSIEIRYATELRVGAAMGGNDQGEEMCLVGRAASFNSESKDLGGFKETIAPGAFTRALSEKQDVRCLFNHSADRVLGRTKNGTLTLEQDQNGLSFRCMLDPNQQAHRDLHAAVKRGDISECSFAFTPNGDNGDAWDNKRDADGNWYISRTLKDVDLFDVSAVTHPAYNDTIVNAREANMTPEIRSIITNLKAKRAATEKRDAEDCLENYIQGIAKSLAEKFPSDTTECCPSSYGKYYICETHEDHVIVSQCGPNDDYCSISYVENPDGDGFVFGTPEPVVKEFVPAERTAKLVAEQRALKASQMKAIADQHAASAAEHAAMADAHTAAADEHTNHADAHKAAADAAAADAASMEKCDATQGDCSVKGCRCQNCMVSARDVDDDYDDEAYDDEDDKKHDKESDDDWRSRKLKNAETRAARLTRKHARYPETRDGDSKVRTKTVAGKSLPASAFAFVGDPNDTSTWKYPIMDKSHAANALARWGQHKGIPADKEAGVYAKIVAKAKSFGIDVTETDAAKAARSVAEKMEAAQRSFTPMTPEEIEDWQIRFEARMRGIEVKAE